MNFEWSTSRAGWPTDYANRYKAAHVPTVWLASCNEETNELYSENQMGMAGLQDKQIRDHLGPVSYYYYTEVKAHSISIIKPKFRYSLGNL
jgi:hypothetical protein